MTERKYSVYEIQSMRKSIARILARQDGPQYPSAKVEQQLQTYMMSETDPEELRQFADIHGWPD